MFGLANGAVPHVFGLIGGLINLAVRGQTRKYRERTEASLQRAATGFLRAKPNVVYPVSQLTAITFKSAKAGLILPDIVLETSDGRKHSFGVQRDDFDKAGAALRQLYPQLCR